MFFPKAGDQVLQPYKEVNFRIIRLIYHTSESIRGRCVSNAVRLCREVHDLSLGRAACYPG
jgi:hypothetical protein